MTQMQDEEAYESIPWDAIVPDDGRGRTRRWLALTVIAGAAAVVVAFVVGSVLPSTPDPGVAAVTAPSSSIEPATTLDEDGSRSLLAEADLLASGGDASVDSAHAAFAEWFVVDFFTFDGTDVTSAAVRARLPDDVFIAQRDSQIRSFVESAHAVRVERADASGTRVLVVVRMLVADGDEAYRRSPARAVEVEVVEGESGPFIADLPAPAPMPEVVAEAIGGEEASMPPHIEEAAVVEAATWGEVIDAVGHRVDDRWRVVATVDVDGLSVPVSLWFDDAGTRLPR